MVTKIHSIAILLAFLIIMMPVCFASDLRINDASGRDNIRNFYRAGDRIKINASVQVDGDPDILPNQLRVYIDGNRDDPFDGTGFCPVRDGASQCSYTRLAPSAGAHKFEVRLYSDDDKFNPDAPTILNRSEVLSSDILGASAASLEVLSKVIRDGKVIVSSEVIDRAFNPANTTLCTGIASVRFFLDDASKPPFKVIPGNNLCAQQVDIEHTFTNLADGEHTIVLLATDRFNQTGSPASDSFTMDSTPPAINDSVSFRDSQTGKAILFIKSDNDLRADISLTITDPLLNTDTITADLSKISAIGEIPPTEIANGLAVWRNVVLRGFQQCQITVRAQDVLGNQGVRTINCDVKADNLGPELIDLSTGFRNANGVLLLAKESLITARIKEDGVGLSRNITLLDLGEVNGDPRTRTIGCQKVEGDWRCLFNVTSTRSSGNKQIGLSMFSIDDLGNAAVQKPRIPAILDADPPRIKNFSMRVIPGQESGITVAAQGATIEFVLVVSGADPARTVIDARVLGGSNQTSLNCQGAQGSDAVCTANVEIVNSGPYRARVTATAGDAAGNTVSQPVDFDVLGLRTDAPNFWSSNAVCSPSLIDRSTTVLIEQKAYCDANLKASSKAVTPIAITFQGGCTGDTSAISQISAFNLGGGSTHPTFDITLHATEYKADAIALTCPIQIVSIVNESGKLFLSTVPESEDVKIKLQFYNQPLGDAFTNIDRQVDEAVKDAKEDLKLVGQLERFFEYASKACNLLQVFRTIQETFTVLSAFFGFAGQAMGGKLTPAGAKAEAVQKALCGQALFIEKSVDGEGSGLDGIYKMLSRLCAFVNCRMESSDEGYLATFGGGAKHCQTIKEKLSAIGGLDEVVDARGAKRGIPVLDEQKYTFYGGNYNSLNVKENLILSSLCLCVPGIIHNVNKYREINCNYALCMLKDVKEKGFPVSYCEEVQSYQTCNFVVGDVFNIFPIVRLWDTVLQIVKNIYANPFELLRFYSGFACKQYCTTEFPEQYTACSYSKILAKLGDAIQSIRAIKSIANFNRVGGACQELEDLTAPKNETGNQTSSGYFGGLL